MHWVDSGDESERLDTSMTTYSFEMISAERLVVFGAELLAVGCTDGYVRLMRYTRPRTLEEVQQFGAFGHPLALGALLWDPVHSLLFLLAHERVSNLVSLHCLDVKRENPKQSVASAFLRIFKTSANADASTNSATVQRCIILKYAGKVAQLEHSLKIEHIVLAGRDFGSEKRRLLVLDKAHASITQYFIEF